MIPAFRQARWTKEKGIAFQFDAEDVIE